MLSIIDFINNIFKHSDIIDRKVNEQPKDLQHQNLIKQYKYNFVFIEHERCQQLLQNKAEIEYHKIINQLYNE